MPRAVRRTVERPDVDGHGSRGQAQRHADRFSLGGALLSVGADLPRGYSKHRRASAFGSLRMIGARCWSLTPLRLAALFRGTDA
jgi:hypothetical protein